METDKVNSWLFLGTTWCKCYNNSTLLSRQKAANKNTTRYSTVSGAPSLPPCTLPSPLHPHPLQWHIDGWQKKKIAPLTMTTCLDESTPNIGTAAADGKTHTNVHYPLLNLWHKHLRYILMETRLRRMSLCLEVKYFSCNPGVARWPGLLVSIKPRL